MKTKKKKKKKLAINLMYINKFKPSRYTDITTHWQHTRSVLKVGFGE